MCCNTKENFTTSKVSHALNVAKYLNHQLNSADTRLRFIIRKTGKGNLIANSGITQSVMQEMTASFYMKKHLTVTLGLNVQEGEVASIFMKNLQTLF